MTKTAGWTVVALAMLLVPWAARAQTPADSVPPIDTDRPDFTDGMHTVPHGDVQLETGYTYSRARGPDPSDQHSFPEMLIRIGVLSRAELRLGENYLIEHSGGVNPGTVRGLTDAYLATKVSLADVHGVVPGIAVEAQANLPTGSDEVSSHRVLPGGALILGWEGTSPWSAGMEFFAAQDAARTGHGVTSLSVQYQLQSRVQCYGEVYAVIPWNDPDSQPAQYINAGVLVLLRNNLQVDARLGAGLNANADRLFTGVGFAVRR